MTEMEELRGAINAQDGREKAAGAKCGVPWEHSGCDWPDAVADVVVELRETLRRRTELLTKAIGWLDSPWTQEGSRTDFIAKVEAELKE